MHANALLYKQTHTHTPYVMSTQTHVHVCAFITWLRYICASAAFRSLSDMKVPAEQYKLSHSARWKTHAWIETFEGINAVRVHWLYFSVDERHQTLTFALLSDKSLVLLSVSDRLNYRIWITYLDNNLAILHLSVKFPIQNHMFSLETSL